MTDELIDIYNESGIHLGTAMKSQAHQEGLWHHSIHCWIVRPQDTGFVLFQKRAPNKDLFPNYLDISAAGHYRAGEPLEQGVREIFEELGLAVRFEDLISLGIKIDVGLYGDNINREFCHVFLLVESRPILNYLVDSGEVFGLVEISVPDGLALFAGHLSTARYSGMFFDQATARWNPTTVQAKAVDFIPRLDPYYLKIFIMAERLLKNQHPLAI